MLGQLLVAVDCGELSKAQACLKSLFSDRRHPQGVFHTMAREIVEPFADMAREQMKREEEENE
jgi:hypothetical protein